MRMTSLATVLLLAARAHAGNTSPIELTITGSVDAGVVATSIASELARPVTPIAATAACHAPCLAIAVTSSSGTVTFTTTEGGTRQRTIDLGSDRAQWTTMLTLLAGNLVRDEAADLLADAPVVAPAETEDVAAVETPPPIVIVPTPPSIVVARPLPPAPSSLFSIGLVPGVSTDLLDLQRSHRISIGLVASATGNVDGIALSGAVDVVRGMSGLQISGAVAVAGDLTGVQIAGAVTVADQSNGAQFAGAASLAHRAHLQVAGAVTAADHAETQIAGAVSVAKRSDLQIAGAVTASYQASTQIAGAVAVSERSDFQIAGAVTSSRDATTQIAGGVNVATHLSGFQLAPINIARRNDGVQLGVINIGGGPDGDSFGLINIVPGGRTDLEASVDSDRIGTLMLRHGGRHWHNVYGFGGQHVSEPNGAPNDDVWMYGLGIGPSFHVANLPVDLDVIAWEVNHGDHHEDHVSLLDQLRLTVGVPVGPVTLVAGGALNAYVSSDHSSPFITARTTMPIDPMDTTVTVKVWPSLFVGARI